MPTFRLTPIEAENPYSAWEASTIKPECLWVYAPDEQGARQIVRRATTVAEMIASPWEDPARVSCIYDDGINVPQGIIRVRPGAISPARVRLALKPYLDPNHAEGERA